MNQDFEQLVTVTFTWHKTMKQGNLPKMNLLKKLKIFN